jgi:hypothetical protein
MTKTTKSSTILAAALAALLLGPAAIVGPTAYFAAQAEGGGGGGGDGGGGGGGGGDGTSPVLDHIRPGLAPSRLLPQRSLRDRQEARREARRAREERRRIARQERHEQAQANRAAKRAAAAAAGLQPERPWIEMTDTNTGEKRTLRVDPNNPNRRIITQETPGRPVFSESYGPPAFPVLVPATR